VRRPAVCDPARGGGEQLVGGCCPTGLLEGERSTLSDGTARFSKARPRMSFARTQRHRCQERSERKHRPATSHRRDSKRRHAHRGPQQVAHLHVHSTAQSAYKPRASAITQPLDSGPSDLLHQPDCTSWRRTQRIAAGPPPLRRAYPERRTTRCSIPPARCAIWTMTRTCASSRQPAPATYRGAGRRAAPPRTSARAWSWHTAAGELRSALGERPAGLRRGDGDVYLHTDLAFEESARPHHTARHTGGSLSGARQPPGLPVEPVTMPTYRGLQPPQL
jgi:hypothetical protein